MVPDHNRAWGAIKAALSADQRQALGEHIGLVDKFFESATQRQLSFQFTKPGRPVKFHYELFWRTSKALEVLTLAEAADVLGIKQAYCRLLAQKSPDHVFYRLIGDEPVTIRRVEVRNDDDTR